MITHNRTIIDELTVTDKPDFTDAQMGVLGDAALRLVNKQTEIVDAEESLKELKRQERVINQDEIPKLMENLCFESITLKDGRKISVRDSVQCAIPAPIRDKAYGWLDKNGHGDLIKTILSAKFNRGEKADADLAYEKLCLLGVKPSLAESVHAGTLKAWAREELAQGHSLPQKFFKVHVVKITKVS